MIRLDSTTRKLQAVLAGAVSANQARCVVGFFDDSREGTATKGQTKITNTSDNTDVDICAAPQQNFVRNIDSVNIYNQDTASITVTVKIDDGGTDSILIKVVLLTLEMLGYTDALGWYALDANGNRKEVTSSVFSSLTVSGNETVGGTLAVTGNTTLTGDLAVNGGDLTTTATTFNLLNATATTINFGAGATAGINIGNASSSVTFAGGIVITGTSVFESAAYLKSYTVGTVPSAATAGGLIYVSNETGGAVPAFSDGTNWRRVTDRAIVS